MLLIIVQQYVCSKKHIILCITLHTIIPVKEDTVNIKSAVYLVLCRTTSKEY